MKENQPTPCCSICDTPVSEQCPDTHFSVTCKDHRNLGTVFQIWMVRRDLGFPFFSPHTTCAVCGESLSYNEIRDIQASDFNIVCSQHRPYASLFDIRTAKLKK